MKAIKIQVFKNPMFDGCSCNGITSKYDSLLLICDDGYIDIDENNVPENAVVVVNQEVGGNVCDYIAPYDHSEHWYSFSGAYGASSDHRYEEIAKIYGALPIHDRKEW